jgi:hypothetical protein
MMKQGFRMVKPGFGVVKSGCLFGFVIRPTGYPGYPARNVLTVYHPFNQFLSLIALIQC